MSVGRKLIWRKWHFLVKALGYMVCVSLPEGENSPSSVRTIADAPA